METILTLILGGLWTILFVSFLFCGLWAYAMHRAHDGDQHRFAVYAFTFGVLMQPVGVAYLLVST